MTRWFQNTVVAPDPGFERLGAAGRSLAVLLSSAAALFFIHFRSGMPISALILGITMALQLNLLIRDETRAERLRTAAFAFGAALIAAPVAVSLHHYVVSGRWLFPLVVFAVFYIHRFGLRAKTAGLMFGWMYLFTTYFEVTPDQILWVAVAFAVAFAAFFLVRFLLWRDDRLRGLRPYFQSLFVNAAIFLEEACEGKDRHRHHLQMSAVAVEDRLYRLGLTEAVSAVQNLRIETERLTSALLQKRYPEVGPDEVRAMARRLRSYPIPDLHLPQHFPRRYARFATAIQQVQAHDTGRRWREGAPVSKKSTSPQKKLERPIVDSHTRRAIQGGLAMLVTLAITYAISPVYWHWGALASLIVFVGTESTGHVFSRGFQRVSGTVFGIVAGLFLSRVFVSFPAIEGTAIVLCVFFMVYLRQVNYTLSTFAVITAVALIYDMADLPGLEMMEVRLVQTGIGAAVGYASARFVLGTHTRKLVQARSAEVLRFVRYALCEKKVNTFADILEMDRKFQDLSDQVEPMLQILNFIHHKRVRRRLAMFDMVVHFAKRSIRTEATDSQTAKMLRERVAQHIDYLVALFDDETPPDSVTLLRGDIETKTPHELALAHLEKSLRDMVEEYTRSE